MTVVAAEKLGLCRHRLERLCTVLQDQVQRQRLPGAVVLVARHGQLALFESVGVLDPARQMVMPRDALFRIYSMTKPIVSVAAMMQVEQGRLLLSDSIANYLPEFSALQVTEQSAGEWRTRAVSQAPTVHDLLRHSAGFSYEFLGTHPVQRQYSQLRLGSREHDLAHLCQQLASVPLIFEPASAFEYSRGSDVLGRVLEVVCQQSLPDILRTQVLEPLGMEQTSFNVAAAEQERIAEPFARDPDGGMQMRVFDAHRPTALASGGGGLLSTAFDYARFLQCMLNRGELHGVRLLGPCTVDYMTSDHLGDLPIASAGSRALLPPGHGFGLGFAVRLHAGLANVPGSVGSYFWGGLAGTTFFVDPALDLYACLMLQAPNQREYYRMLLRNMVYAAVLD